MDAMTNEETLARVASISTPAEAIEMAEAGWWKGIASKDVALAALRQPLLCLPFGDFHRRLFLGGGRQRNIVQCHIIISVKGLSALPCP